MSGSNGSETSLDTSLDDGLPSGRLLVMSLVLCKGQVCTQDGMWRHQTYVTDDVQQS